MDCAANHADETSKRWIFRPATRDDADTYLGDAIRDSERAHTGKGIWDVFLGDDADPSKSLSSVLAYACKNDAQTHFHYTHFIVAEAEGEGPIAAGCGFIYPDFSVSRSYPGMANAAGQLRGTSPEECSEMWKRISYLDDAFPDYDYDHTWMLESIFVSPSYRKKGLAVELIEQLFELGRPQHVRECLVVCGIGNIAAYRLYEKAGFECIGKGESDAAQEAMGYPGFHLFRRCY
jgi:GNAT superfamily N-acetyltransferase